MKKLVFPILLIGLTFCSCQEKVNPLPSENENNVAKIQTLSAAGGLVTASPENLNNPYDNYGKLHNAILQETEDVWEDTTSSLSNVYSAIVASNLDTIDNPILSEDSAIAIASDVMANLDNPSVFVSNTSLTEEGKLYANSLINLLNHWTEYNSYVDFRDAVIAFESNLIQDEALSEIDKSLLLKAASICRYTTKFWVNYYYSQQSTISSNNAMSPNGWLNDAWDAVKTFAKAHPALTKGVLADVVPAVTGNLGVAVLTSAVTYVGVIILS